MTKGYSVLGVGVRSGETVKQVIDRRILNWKNNGQQGECFIGALHGFYETKDDAKGLLYNLRDEESKSFPGRIAMKYRIVPTCKEGGHVFYSPR